MKVLYCTLCGDIVAPFREKEEPRFCRCREFAVWWLDPEHGILRVYGVHDPDYRDKGFVLGIHNAFLHPDARPNRKFIEDLLTDCDESYRFKQDNSPIVRISPGESNDTRWAKKLPEPTT